MSESYNEIMKKIEVTDDMRERILQNIQAANIQKKRGINCFRGLHRYFSIAACFVLLLAAAFLFTKISDTANEQPSGPVVHSGGIVKCSSEKELSELVGFEVGDLTELPFELSQTAYYSYWGVLAEIIYTGKEEEALTFRKSWKEEDNSGDYNQYEQVTVIWVKDAAVTLKGDNGQYSLAIWQKDGVSYSLSFAEGVAEDIMIALIETIQ